MSKHTLPRYPVYVPSKGRFHDGRTARLFTEHKVPFYLVVEPQEEADYRRVFPDADYLVLPWSNHTDAEGNPDGLIAVRNWIKDHATANGHKRHWQWDDNIQKCVRFWRTRRYRCPPGPAMAVVEDLTDRYENVALSGMNYMTFIVPQRDAPKPKDPFTVNCHVYSCSLILNETPFRWRLRYNDDTDYCLQVLAAGWCTILVNAVAVDKAKTMTVSGGNTDALYQGDGRLKMARMLERQWPGVVKVGRRWGRPQHVINWRKFRTPLKRREDVDWAALEAAGSNEYGMVLKRVKE